VYANGDKSASQILAVEGVEETRDGCSMQMATAWVQPEPRMMRQPSPISISPRVARASVARPANNAILLAITPPSSSGTATNFACPQLLMTRGWSRFRQYACRVLSNSAVAVPKCSMDDWGAFDPNRQDLKGLYWEVKPVNGS